MISHRGFIASAMAVVTEGLCPREGVLLRAAPMFHMADMAIGFAGALQDATHVVIPGFHPERVLEAIVRHKVDYRAAGADDDPDADQPSCGEDCRRIVGAASAVWRIADPERSSST